MIGSLDWADSTNGRLSAAQRRRLILTVLFQLFPQGIQYASGRLRLWVNLLPSTALAFDDAMELLPKGTLALEAKQEAIKTLSPTILNHSYRTFLFALALSHKHELAVNPEHLFAASMLHDIGLETPDPDACFAVRGGRVMHDVALRTGADPTAAKTLAEAVTHHISPKIDRKHGPLPQLIQWGSLMDVTGFRLWQISRDYKESTLKEFPRKHMKDKVSACWKEEAATFPDGRVALVEKWTLFSWLARHAPFKS